MPSIKVTHNPIKKRPVHTIQFDSCGEFSAACKQKNVGSYSGAGESSWWGGDSYQTLLTKCRQGDTRFVRGAEEMLSKINANVEIPRAAWEPQVFGAFPMVPEALAGEIECMRILRHPEAESTPLRVYYDPTSSAVIDAKDLQARGTAALALVMAMSAIRPVELWLFSDLDANGRDHANIMVKVQTSPLMISEACFMMCNPGFSRCLMYGYAEKTMGFQGMWGFGDWCDDATERSRLMAASLNANPQDVIIPGISARDDMVKDPIAWVNRQMEKLNQVREHGGWDVEPEAPPKPKRRAFNI